MGKQEQLFRKAALERLSTPERLDQLMHVTTPKGWMALIALSALIVVALIWGIFGNVPTQVSGLGILIRTGGVFDIETQGSGAITEIYVGVGDQIKKGDVVARVALPELLDQIDKAKLQIEDLKAQEKQTTEFGQKDLQLKSVFYQKQRENYQFTIDTSKERLRWLHERLKNQEDLYEDGLITKQTLLDTRQLIVQTENQIQQSQNQIQQLNVTEIESKHQKAQSFLNIELQIKEAQKNLDLLQHQYNSFTQVTSIYTGQVLEVLYDEGTQVVKGKAIVSVELTGKGIKQLEGVLYVGPTKGKMVKLGMEVQVSPANVKREKSGYIIGKVLRVSEFPSSHQAMMRIIKNQELVQTLAGGGAPYEVQVDLIEDTSTYSGLKWSSGKGPNTRIHSGTIASGQIVVKEERPITLVIPALKKFFGI